jgi:hypothetical protein
MIKDGSSAVSKKRDSIGTGSLFGTKRRPTIEEILNMPVEGASEALALTNDKNPEEDHFF